MIFKQTTANTSHIYGNINASNSKNGKLSTYIKIFIFVNKVGYKILTMCI